MEGLSEDSKVKAVNLGGWLVVEGWIKPSLFDGIPNGDMLVSFLSKFFFWVYESWSSWIYSGFFMADLADPFLGMAMQDGTEVQFKSVTLQKYMSAENGGGMNVTVSRDVASSWESFKVRCPITLFGACDFLLALIYNGV